MKELLIVFNGGSLRNFDFKAIDRDKYDILILGLAFRYFRKHKLDYDYYCGVDAVVSKSSEWEICREIKQKNIKCLLTNKCQWSNESIKIMRKNNGKIGFIEDLQKKDDTPFYDTKKWTTGSSAILFGIYLGYKIISLIGLDNDYVNVGQYRERPDGTREVWKDIKNNPNYFFDEYERCGDVKNKPNNVKNLHTDAIIESVDIAHREKVKLINYNYKESFKNHIFTYELNKFK